MERRVGGRLVRPVGAAGSGCGGRQTRPRCLGATVAVNANLLSESLSRRLSGHAEGKRDQVPRPAMSTCDLDALPDQCLGLGGPDAVDRLDDRAQFRRVVNFDGLDVQRVESMLQSVTAASRFFVCVGRGITYRNWWNLVRSGIRRGLVL
jgi:hypothetical protein